MNLILHIKVCKDAFNFSESINIEGCQYIDIDNFSDAAMVETINKAIDLSDRIFAFIQIDGSHDLGLLMKVIQKIMKHKGDSLLLHSGNHEKLDKMLVLMGSEKIKTEDFLLRCNEHFNSTH
ncbi:hypothetical protein [Fulvivirga lutimaris]|uniref:hypothetical protein n=1 Tax=Fulvivirga lutimaris TaxID=1819566 RepID=UPI0012BC1039|nr:hypothetical protein [Fulvivirga lutimaris]MTI41743.1 hypothetical protein [Fulvivirga lutimaris]